MKLLVVIVNFRTAGLAIECLRSLSAEVAEMPGARGVVIDNASGDDSVELMDAAIRENGWADWLTVVPLPRNRGFAAGNNAAIRAALEQDEKPAYVLLLNPDTIVRRGAISALLQFMGAWPAVGIAGSRLEHPDGQPQRSAFRFPTVGSELENGFRLGLVSRLLERHVVAPPVPEGRCAVDWVAGASMMVRREVFETVGLLDEHYFMYYEEVDFCRRARNAGWECWYVPASRVVHLVGQSSGVTDIRAAIRRRRPRYWFASRRRYFLKHHGALRTFLADVAWTVGRAVYEARRTLAFRPRTDPPCLWRDFVKYNFFAAPRHEDMRAVRRAPLAPAASRPQLSETGPLDASPSATRSPRAAPPLTHRSPARRSSSGSPDAATALWTALKRDAQRERRASSPPVENRRERGAPHAEPKAPAPGAEVS